VYCYEQKQQQKTPFFYKLRYCYFFL